MSATVDERSYSIGEAAEALGVTTRTLRYYEELGLVNLARSSAGERRRYGDGEPARLHQIRELQNLLGLDLDEIGTHLGAFDRLDALRDEYKAGASPRRRDEILAEGMAILERLTARVAERQAQLAVFSEELAERLERYRAAGRGARGRRSAD